MTSRLRSIALGTALVAGGALALNAAALHDFRLRRVVVPVLPAGWGPVRVLHISDLHLAPWQTAKIAWVRALASLHPDFVIDTGDNLGHPAALPALRGALNPLLQYPGVFVDGGNDHWAPRMKNPARYLLGPSHRDREETPLDTAALHRLLIDGGWADLNNSATDIELPPGTLRLAGTGDAHEQGDDLPAALRVLESTPADDGAPLLGVTHAPYRRVLDGFAAAGAALVLAGHTHGGQIRLPGFGAIIDNCDLPRQMARGLHEWPVSAAQSVDGAPMRVEISAGLGTSIFAPVRTWCPPEAVMLTLVARDDVAATG
jgi:predicted MPP superfamily phosphohydrolase